jgi:hypothetical protein
MSISRNTSKQNRCFYNSWESWKVFEILWGNQIYRLWSKIRYSIIEYIVSWCWLRCSYNSQSICFFV